MSDGSEFQTVAAATLKPREAKIVWTQGRDIMQNKNFTTESSKGWDFRWTGFNIALDILSMSFQRQSF